MSRTIPKHDFTPSPSAPAPTRLGDHGNAAAQERLREATGDRHARVTGPSAGAARTRSGFEADASLGAADFHRGDQRLEGPQVSARAGGWREENGAVRAGLSASISTGGVDNDGEVQVHGPGASADAWVGEDGAAVGVGASVGDAAIDTNPQARRDQVDHRVRVGVSEGPGLAFRAHWGDEDRDGDQEIGLGGDLGPFSVDVTSEDYGSFFQDAGLPRAREQHRPSTPTPARATPAAPAAAPSGPAAMVAPTAQRAGPSWDRESQTSQLAARTGRPMNELMRLGPDGTYVYDERGTAAAVRQLQRENGLPVTGQMDPATSAALSR